MILTVYYTFIMYTGLTINSGIVTIASSTFNGCTGLTGTLAIPNSVTYINQYAFYGCSHLAGMFVDICKL